LRVFSSRDSAASETETEEVSASATVDSPDEDGVIVGTEDATDNVGEGERSNFGGGGETDSCLTTGTTGVVGVDRLWITTGREGESEDDTGVKTLEEAVLAFLASAAAAAVRAVFAFAVCCFALFNTVWSTVNWIACAAGLVRR